MKTTEQDSIKSLNIAILASDGVDLDAIVAVRRALKDSGISSLIVGCKAGVVRSAQGVNIEIDSNLAEINSIDYDGVFIPGGIGIDHLCDDENTISFVRNAYKNGKLVASSEGGEKLVIKAAQSAQMPNGAFVGEGVISQSDNDANFLKRFLAAITDMQSFNRPDKDFIAN
jgi:catalase